MQVKLVSGDQKRYFTCANVCVTVHGPDTLFVREGFGPPGITIELSPGPTLRLPDDGESVFFTNDNGKTIDAYHWPPRPKKEASGYGDAEIHTPTS